MTRLRLPTALLCAAFCGLAGCGNSNDRGLVTVTGIVLLDGQPAHACNVNFASDAGTESATGYTDDNGRFTLTTRGQKGVLPGKYKVTIFSAENPEPGSVKTMSDVMREKYQGGGNIDMKAASKDASKSLKEVNKTGNATAKKAMALPALYNDLNKTPFTADVPAQTDYKFELKKDAK